MAEHVDTAGCELDGSASPETSIQKGVAGGGGDHEAADGADECIETDGYTGSSSVRPAVVVGVAVTMALAGVFGWLGYQLFADRQGQVQQNELVEAARQGAVNLTTIDYTKVDSDMERILDSSTGTFHDDFEKRSGPFVSVVKHVQSKSEGTVTAAALESQAADQAQVLVSVSVKTSTAAAPQQEPRGFRLRIGVQKVGGVPKVADVQFVP